MSYAVKVKDIKGWRGKVAIYKLEPPFEKYGETLEYVAVSAAPPSVPLAPAGETMIFPANSQRCTSMEELADLKGILCHETALESIGYEIKEEGLQEA